MKTTKNKIEYITLAPKSLNPAAVLSRINKLTEFGLAGPSNWKRNLAISVAKMDSDLEVEQAENQRDAVAQGREESTTSFMSIRAAHRLGTIAAQVVAAACRVGEARAVLDRITQMMATDEAEASKIKQDLAARNQPQVHPEEAKIDALRQEESNINRVLQDTEQEGKSEADEAVGIMVAKFGYAWEPDLNGCCRRLSEIDSEIRQLKEDMETRPSPYAGLKNSYQLMGDLQPIEQRINSALPELAAARAGCEAVEDELETERMIYDIKAEGIFRCLQLRGEAGQLAGTPTPTAGK